MDFKTLYKTVLELSPIEKVLITWQEPYATEQFNQYAGGPEFVPWEGDRPTLEEAEVIVNQLKAKKGNTLLDVACGFGRHDQVLAGTHGLKVSGVDISAGLITAAKRMAEERGLVIDYKVMRAQDVAEGEVFDHAMICFNTFSTFSPKDAPRVLQNINRALKPGATFFMDLDNKPYNCRYGTRDQGWDLMPNTIKLQDTYFHEERSVEVCRDIYAYGDSDEIIEFLMFKQIYTPEEINTLLYVNGFNILNVYGDWDLSPLADDKPKMIITAKKA